ncbi:MAG: hypothetical protein RL701_6071, partial [Pseudomonadota bacterium]
MRQRQRPEANVRKGGAARKGGQGPRQGPARGARDPNAKRGHVSKGPHKGPKRDPRDNRTAAHSPRRDPNGRTDNTAGKRHAPQSRHPAALASRQHQSGKLEAEPTRWTADQLGQALNDHAPA